MNESEFVQIGIAIVAPEELGGVVAVFTNEQVETEGGIDAEYEEVAVPLYIRRLPQNGES